MDKIDLQLIQKLLVNSRITYRELAEQIDLSINATHRRVHNLIETGIIRQFFAQPNIYAINGLKILLFGHSSSNSLIETAKQLGELEQVRFVGIAGGKFLLIEGFLAKLQDLEDFNQKIVKIANLKDPQVGIVNPSKFPSNIKLDLIDLQILNLIKMDARKSNTEIAECLKISTKTIANHIEKMMKNNLAIFSIHWAPEVENNIIFQMEITLKSNQDKIEYFDKFMKMFSSNIGYAQIFSNLPRFIMLTLWTKTPLEMRELYIKINPKNFVNVIPRIVYDGYFFKTWLDDFENITPLIE